MRDRRTGPGFAEENRELEGKIMEQVAVVELTGATAMAATKETVEAVPRIPVDSRPTLRQREEQRRWPSEPPEVVRSMVQRQITDLESRRAWMEGRGVNVEKALAELQAALDALPE